MTTELILWRHGETDWNRETRFQGQADVPLNDRGVQQARAAAQALASLRPDEIISSDLTRAYDTAHELAAQMGLDVQVDSRLREIDVGTWSGRTKAEVMELFPDYQRLSEHDIDFRRSSEGETLREVGVRVGEALIEMAQRRDGQRVIVAGHGNALRMGLGHLLGWGWNSLRGLGVMGNAHWTIVRRRGECWRLIAYNQAVLGTDRPSGQHATP